MNKIISRQEQNHNSGCSQVPAFGCSRALCIWCSRVSLLERTFLMPVGSCKARLLDNYPQEYQNPPPNNNTGLQMHIAPRVTAITQCFRWIFPLKMNPHSHLCCPPKREHESEPKRSGCRGRRRTQTTPLLHKLPEATAAQTDTPVEPRAPLITSATQR